MHVIETTVALLGLATIMAFGFQRFRLPSLLGYIATGCLIGPKGIGWISDTAWVSEFSHLGVLFLLFIVGLELSVDELRHLERRIPLMGVLQLGMTTLVFSVAFKFLGLPWGLSILLGGILSLSSTSIVLKSLEDLNELETVQGRQILGVLLMQDLAIVPLMAMLPLLSQPVGPSYAVDLIWTLAKAAAFLVVALWISMKVMPVILERMMARHNAEIMMLCVVTISLGMAALTGLMGLSYEAGAFIAGLALSGTLFSRHIATESRPFRDVFASLFFVSVGMMLDPHYLWAHMGQVLLVTMVIITVKALLAYSAGLISGTHRWNALWLGATIFQVGEFSFVMLARLMETVHVESSSSALLMSWVPVLINATVLSMFMTPLLLKLLPDWVMKMKLRSLQGSTVPSDSPESTLLDTETFYSGLKDHAIIAGYGPVARQLVKALSLKCIPYVVVDMNLTTVKRLQHDGFPIIYGDVSHRDVLNAVGVTRARLFILTIPDIRAAEVAIQLVKSINPALPCIARSRYRPYVKHLIAAGADDVLYEEFQIALSFIDKALARFDFSVNETNDLIQSIRQREQSKRERRLPLVEKQPIELSENPVFGRLSLMDQLKMEWVALNAESPCVGKTLEESEIRLKTGVTVIALIKPNGEREVNPVGQSRLEAKDVIVVMGTPAQLASLEGMLNLSA
ncbi:MAG: cation:proton antiporter [Cyanobacteria bacterium]|nr:cation:proton antiporter [Cyanobacteriota bacterium]